MCSRKACLCIRLRSSRTVSETGGRSGSGSWVWPTCSSSLASPTAAPRRCICATRSALPWPTPQLPNRPGWRKSPAPIPAAGRRTSSPRPSCSPIRPKRPVRSSGNPACATRSCSQSPRPGRSRPCSASRAASSRSTRTTTSARRRVCTATTCSTRSTRRSSSSTCTTITSRTTPSCPSIS